MLGKLLCKWWSLQKKIKKGKERERRWGTLCNCMGVNAKHKPMKTRHPNVGSVESDIDGSDAEMISQSNWSYSENHRKSQAAMPNAKFVLCISPSLRFYSSQPLSLALSFTLSHSLARSLYRLLSLARSLTTQIVENNLCDWLKTLWMGRNQNNNLHQQ